VAEWGRSGLARKLTSALAGSQRDAERERERKRERFCFGDCISIKSNYLAVGVE